MKHRRQREPRGHATEGLADSPSNELRELPILAQFATGIVAFIVYLSTMAPALHFGDGTELATAAHILGIPHPTGYPLYMLLAHGWSLLLPFGDIITRTTLLSAACMAAASGVSAAICFPLLRAVAPGFSAKTSVIASVAAGMTGAFLLFHWQNAVVTEVYALQFLLAVLFFRRLQQYFATHNPRALVIAAFLCGLGLAHHRLGFMLLPALLIVAVHAWRNLARPRVIRYGAAAALLLLLPLFLYLYLPLRAATRPALNWGNPVTLHAFMNHVRGTEYTTYRLLQARPGVPFTADTYSHFVGRMTGQVLNDVTNQILPCPSVVDFDPILERLTIRPKGFGWVLSGLTLLLIAWGGVLFVKRFPWLGGAIIVSSALNMSSIYLYNIADISDYYLVPFWVAWLCIFLSLATLLTKNPLPSPLRVGAMAYLWLILPLVPLVSNRHTADRSGDQRAEDYARLLLPESRDQLPDNSILITNGDQDIFLSWYMQMVRNQRADVLVFGANFMHRPWYQSFFTDEQIRSAGLKFFSEIPTGVERFAGMLDEAIIAPNIGRRRIFTSASDGALLGTLNRKYRIHPWALLPEDSLGTTQTIYAIDLKSTASASIDTSTTSPPNIGI
ncbi:hypothetical protein CVU37_07320 [candidate division BRC1 bacterium HGW-BRC1-1]|jgi:hypothetical protein|nr:MAG: hypothetical protein CVU37_07320 [candidate division BRC1 bacterium HGW-BRC1-1]